MNLPISPKIVGALCITGPSKDCEKLNMLIVKNYRKGVREKGADLFPRNCKTSSLKSKKGSSSETKWGEKFKVVCM